MIQSFALSIVKLLVRGTPAEVASASLILSKYKTVLLSILLTLPVTNSEFAAGITNTEPTLYSVVKAVPVPVTFLDPTGLVAEPVKLCVVFSIVGVPDSPDPVSYQ